MSNEYSLKNEITVITNATRDILLSTNPDSLILYLFYIKCCDYQKTNQVWATDTFCKKGIGFGDVRFNRAKKALKELGFVEIIPTKDEKGKFSKFYIKVNYKWKDSSKETLLNQQSIQSCDYQSVENPVIGETRTNALSNLSINALSNLNEIYIPKNNSKKEKELIKQKLLLEKINTSPYKEVLDEFNRLFKKKIEKDVTWVENCEFWLNTYTKEEILYALRLWRYGEHWTKNGNRKFSPSLKFLFRLEDTNKQSVNHIQEMLDLKVPERSEDCKTIKEMELFMNMTA